MELAFAAQPKLDRIRRFVKVPLGSELMDPLLAMWREAVGVPTAEIEAVKAARDDGRFHITVLQPRDTRRIVKDEGFVGLEPIVSEALDFKITGFASASNNETSAYFAVVRSVGVHEAWKHMGIEPHDLHITLGFTVKDIHGVNKSESNPTFRSIS